MSLLNLTRLPGRLTAEQAAPLLGFAAHDLPILVKSKLLKPLGNPAPNAVKFFATAEVERLAKDEVWLARATKAIYAHWENRNKNRNNKPGRASDLSLPHETVNGQTTLRPALARNN